MANRKTTTKPKAKTPEVKEQPTKPAPAATKKPSAAKPAVSKTPAKTKAAPKKPAAKRKAPAKPATTPGKAAPKSTKGKSKTGKKGPNGRSAHAVRPTPRDAQIISERQDLVYRMYRMGASVRQISRSLEENGYKRCSKSTISKDLQAAIKESSSRRELSKDQMLDVLIDSTRDLYSVFGTKAVKEKDVKAGRLAMNLLKEIDRLQNISKDQQATTDSKLALAQLLGVDPEAIADGVDPE